MLNPENQIRPLCACGCGQPVNASGKGWYKYLRYHHRRVLPGPMTGKRHSFEAKQKMSASQKRRFKLTGPNRTFGVVPSEETRRKLSEAHKGHKTLKSTRKKISKALMGHPGANKGIPHTEEVRAKLRKAMVDRIKKGLHNHGRGHNGYFYSKKNDRKIHYRSLLEKDWYVFLEKLSYVLSYSTESVSIPYIWEGKIHTYIPDIIVYYANGMSDLIEVKPEFAHNDPKNIAKWNAAKEWCKKKCSRPDRFCVVGYHELKELA